MENRKKVLIVDDEPDIVILLKSRFQSNGLGSRKLNRRQTGHCLGNSPRSWQVPFGNLPTRRTVDLRRGNAINLLDRTIPRQWPSHRPLPTRSDQRRRSKLAGRRYSLKINSGNATSRTNPATANRRAEARWQALRSRSPARPRSG